MRVEIVPTPELGNRSYVVSGAGAAIVIDPQRDLDRVEALVAAGGVPLTQVLETHVHNDYLTGGVELARRSGASYGLNADDEVGFERCPLRDGDELRAGGLRVRVIATPGHTPTHLSYLIDDVSPDRNGPDDSDAGAPAAVFTGGSLLFGSVGRTDLVAAATTTALTRAQYASAHRLAGLPAHTQLFPTHGFGSFCSSGAGSGATASTIGDELAANRVYHADSEAGFVEELLRSLGAYPSYYAHMAPLNRRGPAAVDLTGPLIRADPDDVRARLAAGGTVVDIRDRQAYAAAHLPGSISVNHGDQLATYVGWLVPFAAPLTLIGDSTEQLRRARRQLARIGYDNIDVTDLPVTSLGPVAGYPRRSFDDLAQERRPGDVVLDVRRTEERGDTVVAGSLHVPLHELPARLGTIPAGRIWVHCVSGFRAGTAASLLAGSGRDVVQIDDHIDRACALGLLR